MRREPIRPERHPGGSGAWKREARVAKDASARGPDAAEGWDSQPGPEAGGLGGVWESDEVQLPFDYQKVGKESGPEVPARRPPSGLPRAAARLKGPLPRPGSGSDRAVPWARTGLPRPLWARGHNGGCGSCPLFRARPRGRIPGGQKPRGSACVPRPLACPPPPPPRGLLPPGHGLESCLE